eukprot:scaffold192672_cov31-Tisochrysis_lutea.AAC.1
MKYAARGTSASACPSSLSERPCPYQCDESIMLTPRLRQECTISRARSISSTASSANQTAGSPKLPSAAASVSPEPFPAVNMPPRPEAPKEMIETRP